MHTGVVALTITFTKVPSLAIKFNITSTMLREFVLHSRNLSSKVTSREKIYPIMELEELSIFLHALDNFSHNET